MGTPGRGDRSLGAPLPGPVRGGGYGSLAVLVYGNVATLSRGALSSALGLATCVGCTVPVLVPLVALSGGTATSVAAAAYAWSYDLGTLLFLVTLGLLYVIPRRAVG